MPNPMPSVVRVDPESEARGLAALESTSPSAVFAQMSQVFADELAASIRSSPLIDLYARELYGVDRRVDESDEALRARIWARLDPIMPNQATEGVMALIVNIAISPLDDRTMFGQTSRVAPGRRSNRVTLTLEMRDEELEALGRISQDRSEIMIQRAWPGERQGLSGVTQTFSTAIREVYREPPFGVAYLPDLPVPKEPTDAWDRLDSLDLGDA